MWKHLQRMHTSSGMLFFFFKPAVVSFNYEKYYEKWKITDKGEWWAISQYTTFHWRATISTVSSARHRAGCGWTWCRGGAQRRTRWGVEGENIVVLNTDMWSLYWMCQRFPRKRTSRVGYILTTKQLWFIYIQSVISQRQTGKLYVPPLCLSYS